MKFFISISFYILPARLIHGMIKGVYSMPLHHLTTWAAIQDTTAVLNDEYVF